MKEAPLWSVVVIAKNEEKHLPRLLDSLKEFQDRGGEIIVVDTGSTDKTVGLALQRHCKVFTMGDTFVHTLQPPDVDVTNTQFVVNGEPPILKDWDTFFHYSQARNYGADRAECDMIAMPDCDEYYTALDIDAINAEIRAGKKQLEYDFVYSHRPDGSPDIAFKHCKFYDRRAMKWEGIIHEILVSRLEDGEIRNITLLPRAIKLEHSQNRSTDRSHYLKGLAWACHIEPKNDRNSHYFARELMYSGCRPQSALREFHRHVEMNGWAAERAQSLIFIGDIRWGLGEKDAARGAWHRALDKDSGRRAAWMALARSYYQENDPQRAACYAAAALQVGPSSYYGNHGADYAEAPHEILYWAHWQLGDKAKSSDHWHKAYNFQPLNSKFLADAQFYMELPKVSIVIPTLGREAQLKRCLELIRQNANYPNYEVIVQKDSFTDRQGVAKTLAEGVKAASGQLIMYLGNDCEPQPDFLIHAVLVFLNKFTSESVAGLVALNDGVWDGTLATHWLASRKLLDYLPTPHFFYFGYDHVGCDNELTGWAKINRRYAYAPWSRIIHKTHAQGDIAEQDEVAKLAWNEASVLHDRILLQTRSAQYGFSISEELKS